MSTLKEKGVHPPDFVVDEWTQDQTRIVDQWLNNSSMEVPEFILLWMYDGTPESLISMYNTVGMDIGPDPNDWTTEERIKAFQWFVLTNLGEETMEAPIPPAHVAKAANLELPLMTNHFTFLVGSLSPQMDSQQSYTYVQQVTALVESDPAGRRIILYLTDTKEARTANILHSLYQHGGWINMSVIQHGDSVEEIIFSDAFFDGYLENFTKVNNFNVNGPIVWKCVFGFGKCESTVGDQIFEYGEEDGTDD